MSQELNTPVIIFYSVTIIVDSQLDPFEGHTD